MAAPSKLIKLGHARDHLRQHFAIDAGLENMDHRPLGSDPKKVDFETRDTCRQQMQRCRDNAHWEISGMIGGSKITVWKERPDGGLEPAGSKWAQQTFDAPGTASDSLYFDRTEWDHLLIELTSEQSRRYFESASAGSSTDHNRLIELYRRDVVREYSEAEAGITSKFSLANRMQSDAHISALNEAAEVAVLRMIAKVRQLGIRLYTLVEVQSKAAFDELATDIRKKAIGLNGRMPAPSNGALADKFAREARERIVGEIAKWQLESSLELSPVRDSPQSNVAELANAAPAGAVFDAPRADWMELWEGPLRFRATFDRGKFGSGHSFDDINKNGLGRSKDREIYTVRVDSTDGAIVIEWHVGLPGQKPQEVRYYDGHPGRALYNQLRDDGSFRKRHFGHLPIDLRDRAVGAYAIAVSIREWMELEFFNAVHEGQCEIWARIGSRVASFSHISADVFRAYKVKCWGYGNSGAAWAELEGQPSLYSIHVAPIPSDVKDGLGNANVAATAKEKNSKKQPGRPKGSGSYLTMDLLYHQEIRELLDANKAKSLNDAVTKVVRKHGPKIGGASEAAKIDRLRKNHSAAIDILGSKINSDQT